MDIDVDIDLEAKPADPKPALEDEEKIKRMNEIFDKADKEQLQDLDKNKNNFVLLVAHFRRIYYHRIAAAMFCLLWLLSMNVVIVVYHFDREQMETEYKLCPSSQKLGETCDWNKEGGTPECPAFWKGDKNSQECVDLEKVQIAKEIPKEDDWIRCPVGSTNVFFYQKTV